MARMFTNSIYYVHEKSGMAELNKDVPVSQPKSITSAIPSFSIILTLLFEPSSTSRRARSVSRYWIAKVHWRKSL